LKRDLRCAKAIAMTKVCIVGAGAIGGVLGTHLAAGAIELDALLSAVREIGQRVGVATPLHEPGDDPATCPVGAQRARRRRIGRDNVIDSRADVYCASAHVFGSRISRYDVLADMNTAKERVRWRYFSRDCS